MLYQPRYSAFNPSTPYRYRRREFYGSAMVQALRLGKSPGAHLVEKFTIKEKKDGFNGSGTGNGTSARFINMPRGGDGDGDGGEDGSVPTRLCPGERECRAERSDTIAECESDAEEEGRRPEQKLSEPITGTKTQENPNTPLNEKKGTNETPPETFLVVGTTWDKTEHPPDKNIEFDGLPDNTDYKCKQNLAGAEVEPKQGRQEDRSNSDLSKTKEDAEGLTNTSEDKSKEDLPKKKVKTKPGKQEDRPNSDLSKTKEENEGLTNNPEDKIKPKAKVKTKGLTNKPENKIKPELPEANEEKIELYGKKEQKHKPNLPKTKLEPTGLPDKPEEKVLLKTKNEKKGISDKALDKHELDLSKTRVETKGLPDKLKIDLPKTREDKNRLISKNEDKPKADLPGTKLEPKGLLDKQEITAKTDLPRTKEGYKEDKALFQKKEVKPEPVLPKTKLEPIKSPDKPDLPKAKLETKGLSDKKEDNHKPDLLKAKVETKGLPNKSEEKSKPDLLKAKNETKGLPDSPLNKRTSNLNVLISKNEDKPNTDLPKTKLEPKVLPDKPENKPKPDLPKTKIELKGLTDKPEDKFKLDLSNTKLEPKGLSDIQEANAKTKFAKLKVETKGLPENKSKPDSLATKVECKQLLGIQEDKLKPDLPKTKLEPKGLSDKKEENQIFDSHKTKVEPKKLLGIQEDKLKPDLPKTKLEPTGSPDKPEDKFKPDLPGTKLVPKGLSDKKEFNQKFDLPNAKVEAEGLREKPENKPKPDLLKTKLKPKGLSDKPEEKPRPDLSKSKLESKGFPSKPEDKPNELLNKEGVNGKLDVFKSKIDEETKVLNGKPGFSLEKEEAVGTVNEELSNEKSRLFKCTTHEDLTDPTGYDSYTDNNDCVEVEVEEYEMESDEVSGKKKVIVKKTGSQVKVTPLEAKPPKGGEMEVSIPGELMRQISKKRLSLVDEDVCRLVERKTSITDDIIVQEAAYLDSMIRVEMLDRRKSSLGFPAIPEEVKEEKKETSEMPRDDRRAAWKKQTLKRSVKTLGGFYKPQVQDDSSSEDEDDDEECDVNCHRKCQLLMPNLCGINQKLMAEALSRLQLKVRPSMGESNTNSSEYSESSESTTAGRVSPPAKTLPRFRSYSINDFQFLKVLGKGSFGKVLLAELKGSECYYAVKCLKKDVVLEDDDVECTLIERKVLALATGHPYFSHLFCTFQTESHLFFVMEYLNGGDLMFHIQQSGRFDEGRARFYAAEIVSGLSFLHKWGIVYRDLKLDNVLLDFDGHVRIADFGMCKLQIYLDKTTDTFCGTPDYMAPEIIKGLKYNQCVDWWSFGILLYEMLVGQSPFSGCDEDDLFWSICNTRPHMPSYLSVPAKSILLDLMEKNWTKRLGSSENGAADVMNHAFFDGFKWPLLERKMLDPPFKPTMKHPLDTKYFDKVFTSEKPVLTPVDKTILESMDQTQFQGFSYTNPNATE